MGLPYRLAGPIGESAALGLVVLQPDETIEAEFRRLMPGEGVALHVTRIASGAEVSAASLAAMEAALPAAAALLPPAREFDVVGYACTSGATVIGPERVARLVREGAATRAVTDPLTATLAAAAALHLRRIGFVTPYVAEVSAAMRARLEAAGLAIARFGSFEEAVEARVARIDPASVLAAAVATGEGPEVDGVFLACTNLRTVEIVALAEAALGKPVLSSNLALAWHMLALAGLEPPENAPGRLMATGAELAAR